VVKIARAFSPSCAIIHVHCFIFLGWGSIGDAFGVLFALTFTGLLIIIFECIPWNCYCLLKAALGVFPHSHFYSMTGVIDVLQTSKRARVMKH